MCLRITELIALGLAVSEVAAINSNNANMWRKGFLIPESWMAINNG